MESRLALMHFAKTTEKLKLIFNDIGYFQSEPLNY